MFDDLSTKKKFGILLIFITVLILFIMLSPQPSENKFNDEIMKMSEKVEKDGRQLDYDEMTADEVDKMTELVKEEEKRIYDRIIDFNKNCDKNGILSQHCSQFGRLYRICVEEWMDRMTTETCYPAMLFYLMCLSSGEDVNSCRMKFFFPKDPPDGYIYVQKYQ